MGDCRQRHLHRRVWAAFCAPDIAVLADFSRRNADLLEQLDVSGISRLSSGALPDAYPGASGWVRLFMEPPERHFHQLRNRVFLARLWPHRGLRIHRRFDACRRDIHRTFLAANARVGFGGHLALATTWSRPGLKEDVRHRAPSTVWKHSIYGIYTD